jgi:drug/metabolite transporter (DMT)-like permease
MMWELFVGESLSTLYAVVTKNATLSITLQFFLRAIVYVITAFVQGGRWFNSPLSWKLTILNYFHVFSSYYAFKELPVSISILIFYLYPLFYLLLQGVRSPLFYVLFAACFYGIYLIYQSQTEEFSEEKKQKINIKSLAAILFSGFSEALTLYYVTKYPSTVSTSSQMFITYILSAVILLFQVNKKELFNTENRKQVFNISAFNLVIGYLAYTLLYNAAKGLPPGEYSIYTFFGIITGFLSGKYVFNEKFSPNSWKGISLIIGSMLATYFLPK